MPLSRERKTLIVVAGLAAAVFCADRLLMGGSLSGPQSAQAAGSLAPDPEPLVSQPVAPLPAASSRPLAARLTSAEPRPDDHSLARRLDRLTPQLPDETPDAFRPSAHWDRAAAAPAPPPAPEAFDARRFARNHPLDAITLAQDDAYAMVNGQTLRVGYTRRGMKLTEIGDRWVVWTGHGLRVKIHLDPLRK
ncbi:MAG: hypothetical protein AAGG38_09650 [Planctomycetota bacterium]